MWKMVIKTEGWNSECLRIGFSEYYLAQREMDNQSIGRWGEDNIKQDIDEVGGCDKVGPIGIVLAHNRVMCQTFVLVVMDLQVPSLPVSLINFKQMIQNLWFHLSNCRWISLFL